MDKQQTRSQDVTAPRQSAGYQTGSYQSSSAAGGSTSEKVATTIVIKNSNGSTTPVTLHREGGDWVGPKGEHYDHLPTEAELRPIYGI
jgi:acetyl esterase/lipase